ncbi:MAG TPA: YciI family protein [Nitrososphaerales archaeon]|nr:YciI family protein [Nitrososphaerales archaeon]
MINEQGPAWDSKLPMRNQKGWNEHAAFMDALADEGFIVLGGPLKNYPKHRTLLIFDAPDQETVRARMAADPWIRDGTLRILDIYGWEILLGTLKK